MKPSEACVAFIKQAEGFRAAAYQDVGGCWTVGYGETRGVKPGDRVTTAEADLMLRANLSVVASAIMRLVTVPLTQGQFDALADFAYNVGIGEFQRSTLLKMLNAGCYSEAAAQLRRWTIAGGQPREALEKRRQREFEWFTASASEPIQTA